MDQNAFEFARPYWLAAGAVACGLVVWGMFAVDRWRTAALGKLAHPRFHARLTPAVSPRLRWTRRILWLAAVMLLCAAASGPQAGFEMREVKRRGIDILFAIDASRSMLAEDLQPNRLERARMGIHDFLDRLKGDRVGLVPFAGSSYPLCPLTVDYDAFRESLDALDTDIIPKAGTDVAAAIREAQKLLDQQASRHRILVLITDGEDLQGDAMDAAKEAKEKGMTVHTIGVGSVEGVQIPVTYQNGQRDYVRDQNGQVVVTKLDEKALQEIADATGGLYAPLGRGAEGLDRIYKEKLRLEPQNDQQSKMEKIPLLRYEWPLAAALLTLLMTFILPDRRREVKPRALPSAARRKPMPGVSVVLTVSAALLVLPGVADAEEDARVTFNRATEEYGAGNFIQAESTLRAALRTPDISLQKRAYYNLGNTLYRLGQQAQKPEDMKKQWEEAIKAYDGAIALNASDEDAKYNRDLVQRKLDEMNKQQDQKDDQKKDDKKEKKEDEKKEQEKKEDDQKNGQQQGDEEEKKDGQQQDSKEQEGGDSQEQKDQNQSSDQKTGDQDAQKKEGGNSEGEQKEGEQKDQQPGEGGEKEEKEKNAGQEQKEAAENKEGEKKGAAQAEGKGGEQKDAKDKVGEAKSIAEERSASNEMSAEEARRLLQTLRREERTVIPIDRPPPQRRGRDLNNTTKGKTW